MAIRAPSTRNFDIIITRGNDFDVVVVDNNMKDKRVPFYAHMQQQKYLWVLVQVRTGFVVAVISSIISLWVYQCQYANNKVTVGQS